MRRLRIAAVAAAMALTASSASAFNLGTGLQFNSTNKDTIELATPVAVGNGGTGADMSATGGAGYFVKQGSVGAAFSAEVIDLGTDTNGNYVSSATSGGGLTLTGTEGASLGVLLPTATDALSSTTSSGSGLELVSAGLVMLQGCSDNQILKWNETADTWGCAADATGSAVVPTYALTSESKITLGASAAIYLSLDGRINSSESDCRTPLKDATINRLSCLSTAAQTAGDVTFTLGAGACTSALTYDGSTNTVSATANTPTEGSDAAKSSTGLQCFCVKLSTGVGDAMASAYLNCSYKMTAAS